MAREHWFAVRGNPEFEVFSMNIDSVLCFQAHHSGAVEEILRDPLRIYHIEHSAGSGWTPEASDAMYRRIEAKGIPLLGFDRVIRWGIQMRKMNRPLLFNREDWGLANETLREFILMGGTWQVSTAVAAHAA
jgi:hypothetical protein